LKTCVFYCSNNVDAHRLALLGAETGAIKAIGLPCSGKVDVPYLVKALETGADAVVVVACPKKECRHFEGSSRAHKRAEAVEALLEEIGFGAGRIAVIECGPGGAGEVSRHISQFIEQVRNLPEARTAEGAMTPPQRLVA
jgi:coenzyme F420-reducing hydrogenase delta subunit